MRSSIIQIISGSKARNGSRGLGRLSLTLTIILFLAACGVDDDASDASEPPVSAATDSIPSTEEAIKIRWGVNNPYFNGNIPVTVGIESGIFSEYGLEVTAVETQTPMPAVIAGDADFAVGGAPPWLSAVAQGKDAVVVATLFPKATQAVMVSPDSPLVEFKDQWPEAITGLQGMTIGVSVAGAQVDLSTRYLLLQAGLVPDEDVTVAALGGGTPQVAAFEDGRVEAIMGFVPFIQVLEGRGTAVSIFDFTNMPEGAPDTLNQPYMLAIADPTFIEENPEVVQRLQDALVAVGEFIADDENTAELIAILSPHFEGLEPAVIEQIIAQMREAGFDPSYTCDDFTKAVDMMTALEILDQQLECETYVKAG